MFNRKAQSKGLFVLAMLVLGILLSACASGVAQPADDVLNNTISVTGFGEASGVPDSASIQLGVSILGVDVTSAIDQSNATIEKITEALAVLGIAQEDIQTTNFNVWPDDRFGSESGLLSSERQFRVETNLQIRVTGVDNVGEAIQAALDAGANNIYGLNFSIKDPSALVSEARAAAIEDAKERAEEIAEAMGVELGDALIVAESSGGFIPQLSGLAFAETAVGGGPPLSPGQTSVSAQISITFAIAR